MGEENECELSLGRKPARDEGAFPQEASAFAREFLKFDTHVRRHFGPRPSNQLLLLGDGASSGLNSLTVCGLQFMANLGCLGSPVVQWHPLLPFGVFPTHCQSQRGFPVSTWATGQLDERQPSIETHESSLRILPLVESSSM